MNLLDYAIAKGGTGTIICPVYSATAKRARCSPGTLYMIGRGHKLPSAKLATRIELATNSRVTRNELRPDVFGARPA